MDKFFVSEEKKFNVINIELAGFALKRFEKVFVAQMLKKYLITIT
jgi:hypothetical protein